ncbi:MAG: M48 family metallopeptidase [Methanobacteriaceae archaeon]
MISMMDYTITRSKRRTISLRINDDASLEVKAPLKLSEKEIASFVESKENWIKKHIGRVTRNHNLKNNFTLNFNDTVTIIGKNTKIIPISGKRAKYQINNSSDKNYFLIPEILDSEEIRQTVIKLAKKIAKFYITERVLFFKEIIGVAPRSVRINSAKTRWGSCSGKNNLNFTWKLIMATEDVIDYVVIHELSHIKQKNHSPKFWDIVEKTIPEYKERQNNLKKLGETLNKENWD